MSIQSTQALAQRGYCLSTHKHTQHTQIYKDISQQQPYDVIESRKYWNGPPFLTWTRNSVKQYIGGTWHEINFVNTGAHTGKTIVFNEIKLLQYERHLLPNIFPRNAHRMTSPSGQEFLPLWPIKGIEIEILSCYKKMARLSSTTSL